jgi:hypothetical protein
LSVSRAKESFLDRLRREREEAQRPPEVQAQSAFTQEENYDEYQETYHPLPVIEKEVSSDESSEEEEEEIPQVPVKKFQPKPEVKDYSVSVFDQLTTYQCLIKNYFRTATTHQT